jgi:murein DD-endopeptidase MepM/ murein hydrolase activator NlpD
MVFPLTFLPKESYKEGMRRFGANRDGGKRKHAGCDLYAPIGTPVRAVAKGIITQFKYFYLGTYYLAIDHDDFTVRYGEIKSELPAGIAVGVEVSEGTTIGYIGHLKGLKMSMLHFEMYSGEATGPLTVKANKPYQRRSDLLNPTSHLDSWAAELMAPGLTAFAKPWGSRCIRHDFL